MLDLSKSPDPTASAAPPASKTARGQRLWAALLVLDSLFVIVFGGALAAKLYKFWQAPAPPPVAARRRPMPVKPPAPPPKPAETPTPSVNANPKDARGGSHPLAEPKPVEPAKGPVPKPSLLNEPPKHEAATLKESAKSKAPALDVGAGAAGKARPVEFHLSAPSAKKVELSGAFIVRGNGRKKMIKQSDGTWTLTLYLTPNTYRYHFLIDGKKTLDPDNPKTDRGASVLAVGSN